MIIRNTSVVTTSLKSKTNVVPVEIVVMGDAHDKPGRSKDRFKWIGKYINNTNPDHFVCIGDFLTLDSLAKHQELGSRQDFDRTQFKDDKESAEEALYILNKAMGSEVPKHITLGNHEYRAERESDLRPKECGHYKNEILSMFLNNNYQVTPYKEYLDIEGLKFTHIPITGNGTPFGGENCESRIAKGLKWSCVIGHTHKFKYITESKIGNNENVTVLNVGTSLPDGVVENYAMLSTTGWTYGIVRITVLEGNIIGHQHIPMTYLESKYG